MGSLFQGTPQTATSYTTSSTETPQWMQDAIYNQVQWAQNAANMPYQEYNLPRVAELSPLQQQAYSNVVKNQGAWNAAMDAAGTGMKDLSGKTTFDQLRTDQNQYLRPNMVEQGLNAGQNLYGRASGLDVVGAAQPYLNQAAQTSAQGVGQYMSPYQQNVMDVIAKQGARNLTENVLPGVSDAFIRAGQFGSNRMGEFGSRAVRDTQEAILNQQAQLANQGYSQALGAAQTDLARQAQLAGTAGSLTGQQAQNLANIGQAQTALGQNQQQLGLGAAQATQTAQAQDYNRQMSALTNMANMAQQRQAMGTADVAALEAAGLAQQGQQQQQLNAAYDQYMAPQNYTKNQLDWLNTQVRGMAPIVPTNTTQAGTTTGGTYSASPLSQLASGIYTYKGLQNLG